MEPELFRLEFYIQLANFCKINLKNKSMYFVPGFNIVS